MFALINFFNAFVCQNILVIYTRNGSFRIFCYVRHDFPTKTHLLRIEIKWIMVKYKIQYKCLFSPCQMSICHAKLNGIENDSTNKKNGITHCFCSTECCGHKNNRFFYKNWRKLYSKTLQIKKSCEKSNLRRDLMIFNCSSYRFGKSWVWAIKIDSKS